MRLCKDCEHFRSLLFAGNMCERPLSQKFSPVTGAYVDRAHTYAAEERREPGLIFGRNRCGPDAIYFEPRTTPTPEETQRAMYTQNQAANCAAQQNALTSTDARDTLVQGRDRRNMASRVFSPSPHIQTQGQSGERE